MKHFEQGRALVIGVGSYSDKRWDAPTASRDAQGCYNALVDSDGAGYARSEAEILLDAHATREGVGKAFERLADRCTAESIVFISITSHGALGDDGLYYLATSDAQFTAAPDERIKGQTGFSVGDLAQALRAIPAPQVLIVVNACFAGHLGPRLSQGAISPDSVIALPDEASKEILATGEGRAIISASKPEQRSYYPTTADHSYFGQALIQALKGGHESERSGYVGLYELYQTIYRHVRSATMRAHRLQEPTLTLVQGVGPFPVAAYPHTKSGDGRIGQQPPPGTAVRALPPMSNSAADRGVTLARSPGLRKGNNSDRGSLSTVAGRVIEPMNALDFDPEKFINCDSEHQIFADLLSFGDHARVLAVRGDSGTGKSQLLRSFVHKCRTAYSRRVPVCLLSLDQPGDAVLPLIQDMARQLSSFGLSFPTFRQLESARVANDFTRIRSSIYLEGAVFEGAKDGRTSNTMINPERVERINISTDLVEFTSEQISLAQEVSINAFFDDLRVYCAHAPVVLLLDTYEKSQAQVRTWLNEFFLEHFFFDLEQRPQYLVTVIAGQDTPAFAHLWPRHMCETVVRTVSQINAWDRTHIESYCLALGVSPQYAPIELIHQLVQAGAMTPELMKGVIYLARRQVRP